MNPSFLYAEINLICIMVLLLLAYKAKDSMLLQEQRFEYLRVVAATVVCFLVDGLWVFADATHTEWAHGLNWGLNIVSFASAALIGFYCFRLIETVEGSSLVKVQRYNRLTYVPITILLLLIFSSYKTGWLFYVDSNNMYHRGPAYILQLLGAYGYVAFAGAKAFYLAYKTHDYVAKSNYRTLGTFVLPTLIFGSLQLAVPSYPVLCIGNTLGILYVYITLQEQLISIDALTRINNRNQLMQRLASRMGKTAHATALHLLILDVDYFKDINDRYGHVEGDKALVEVAGALMRVGRRYRCFISRYGGDEFVVISEHSSEGFVEELSDALRAEVRAIKKPYKLQVSIGYAQYEPWMKTQQQFIGAADKELYKAKNNRLRNRIA